MTFKRACIILPVFFFGFRLFAYYSDPWLHFERYVHSEYGLYENLTVVFLLLAIILAVRIFSRLKSESLPLKKTILLGFTVGCVYFAGEEISWGQHFFLWQTPEAWEQINKQNETNIHNTYAIFDHFPRELLIAGLVFYCAFLPLAALLPILRNGYWEKRFAWLYPEPRLALVVGFMLLTRFPDRIVKIFSGINPIPYPINPKEFQELFIALTLLLIAWGLLDKSKDKIRDWKADQPAALAIGIYVLVMVPVFLISMRPISILFFCLATALFLVVQFTNKASTSQPTSDPIQ